MVEGYHPPIIETQMDKKTDNQMEPGVLEGFVLGIQMPAFVVAQGRSSKTHALSRFLLAKGVQEALEKARCTGFLPILNFRQPVSQRILKYSL